MLKAQVDRGSEGIEHTIAFNEGSIEQMEALWM